MYVIHQYKPGCLLLAKEISSFHKYACADFNIKSTSELSVKIISAGTGPKPTEINRNTSLQSSRLWIRPFLYNKGFLHHRAAMSPPSYPLTVHSTSVLKLTEKQQTTQMNLTGNVLSDGKRYVKSHQLYPMLR